MSKDSSAQYYQNKKEMKDFIVFQKKKKKKKEQYVCERYKNLPKMKNKSWLSIAKNITK